MRNRLEAGADHVEALAREQNPVQAVVELVWNSLDAEAHEVKAGLLRNDVDGIIDVTVEDDGHGITRDEINSAFKWVGIRGNAALQPRKASKHGHCTASEAKADSVRLHWAQPCDGHLGPMTRLANAIGARCWQLSLNAPAITQLRLAGSQLTQ